MKNDVISPEFDENGRPLRRIRSFVRRQGRLTKGQEHALENYWPVMGVEFSEDMLDFPALFGREAPVTLEIGFGMGASLVAMAKDRPEQDFLSFHFLFSLLSILQLAWKLPKPLLKVSCFSFSCFHLSFSLISCRITTHTFSMPLYPCFWI